MQAVLGTLEHYSNGQQTRVPNIPVALRRWLSEIFGCQHREMSRPFSRHGETFRVCLGCGGRRRFDEQKWQMDGAYYYNAARTSDLSDTTLGACNALRRLRTAA